MPSLLLTWYITTRFPLDGGPDAEQLFIPSDQNIGKVSCESN